MGQITFRVNFYDSGALLRAIRVSKAQLKNYDNLEMAVVMQRVHNRWVKLHLGSISKGLILSQILLKTISILKSFWVINDSKAELKNYDNIEMAVVMQQVHNRWVKLHLGSNSWGIMESQVLLNTFWVINDSKVEFKH